MSRNYHFAGDSEQQTTCYRDRVRRLPSIYTKFVSADIITVLGKMHRSLPLSFSLPMLMVPYYLAIRKCNNAFKVQLHLAVFVVVSGVVFIKLQLVLCCRIYEYLPMTKSA